MREIMPLNRDWLYARGLPKDGTPSFEGTDGECVELPHANTLLPYNYLDEQAYHFRLQKDAVCVRAMEA